MQKVKYFINSYRGWGKVCGPSVGICSPTDRYGHWIVSSSRLSLQVPYLQCKCKHYIQEVIYFSLHDHIPVQYTSTCINNHYKDHMVLPLHWLSQFTIQSVTLHQGLYSSYYSELHTTLLKFITRESSIGCSDIS